MIDKGKGAYNLVCDNCGKVNDEEFGSWHEAVEAKKELGWKSQKVNGEWEDWCDECCVGEDGERY